MKQEEIESFLQERERIRQVVGRIGGRPTIYYRILQIFLIVFIIIPFILAIFVHGLARLITIEIGVLLLSIKFAYFLHNEARVTHFQFWILSSLEWRLNEISQRMTHLDTNISEIKNKIGIGKTEEKR